MECIVYTKSQNNLTYMLRAVWFTKSRDTLVRLPELYVFSLSGGGAVSGITVVNRHLRNLSIKIRESISYFVGAIFMESYKSSV